MKYRQLYAVLEKRHKESFDFSYSDRSGWRSPSPSYIDSIRSLWIIAVDPAARRRYWITHEGSDMKIVVGKIDENGHNCGTLYCTYCCTRAELAEKLQKFFEEKPAA